MSQLALFDAPTVCSIAECTRLVNRKKLQLCEPHYKRKWRHGDPLAGGPMRLDVKAAKPVQDFPDGTRICTECEERKPLDSYRRDASGTAGRRAKCADCQSGAVRVWYSENRERLTTMAATRRRANPELHRRRDLERYERDKDKRIALVVEAGHRRRALLRGAESDRGITVISLRKRDGDDCCYCKQTMTFVRGNGRAFVPTKATIEHVIALARGGSHTWANVALACWQCNVRKNAKSLDEWLAISQGDVDSAA